MTSLNSNLGPEAIQALESIESIEEFFGDLIRTNPSLNNQELSRSTDVMRVVMDFLGNTSNSLWDEHLLQGQPFSEEAQRAILGNPLYDAACKIYQERYNLGHFFGWCRTIEDTMEGFTNLWYAVPVLQQMKKAAQEAEQAAGSDGLNLSLASVGAAAEVMAGSEESIQSCVAGTAGSAFARASGIDAVLCARELSLKDTLSREEEELMKIIPQEEIERARGLSEEEVADLVEKQKGLVYIMDLVEALELAGDTNRLTAWLNQKGYNNLPSSEREDSGSDSFLPRSNDHTQ